MSLQARIAEDLKTAMKARDRARTSALRMLLAALKNAAVAEGLGPRGELSDEQVVRVVRSETKRRREAAEAFEAAGRDESAATERAEADAYAAYLPAQLDDDELTALVDEVVAELGASDVSDMGRVMKATMPRVAGRADGARVSGVVRERLASARG